MIHVANGYYQGRWTADELAPTEAYLHPYLTRDMRQSVKGQSDRMDGHVVDGRDERQILSSRRELGVTRLPGQGYASRTFGTQHEPFGELVGMQVVRQV